MDIGGGEIVEVFANRTMHKQLSECFGGLIRIVYVGREQNNYGHAKKVYRVYKQETNVETSKVKPKKVENRKGSDDGK